MLTVLMTIRDGGRTLLEVLDAYERLESPPGGHRFVVVDNGSTDASAALLRARTGSLPLFVLSEPRPGQCRARNLGLEHALGLDGDLVVFTDGDTLPRPDWLVRLREAVDGQPGFGLFAGTVRPRWPAGSAPWTASAVRAGPTWAACDRAVSGPIDATEGLGANIAVRRALLNDGIRFDETLGPDGTLDYPMGSETDFLKRLEARGSRAWFAREAVVEHVVHPHQVEPEWILSRTVRFGRGCVRLGTARLSPTSGPAARLVFAVDVIGRRVALLRARLVRDQGAALKARWKLCFLLGHVIEARRVRGRTGLGAFAPLFPRSVRRYADGVRPCAKTEPTAFAAPRVVEPSRGVG